MTTTVFHTAAKTNYTRLLHIATTDECDAKDQFGMTPILWAASYGHSEALSVLHLKGADIDEHDTFGNTALHLAVARGYTECVKFLLDARANPYSRNLEGYTPQQLAVAMKDREDILDLINKTLDKYTTIDRYSAINFKEKAEQNYEKLQKQFTKKLAKEDHTDDEEDSPI